jgi:hypothetical protein
MQHGKDFMVDKPGATSLEQLAELRRVLADPVLIYAIAYRERLENGATIRAGELVRDGAIGRAIQQEPRLLRRRCGMSGIQIIRAFRTSGTSCFAATESSATSVSLGLRLPRCRRGATRT